MVMHDKEHLKRIKKKGVGSGAGDNQLGLDHHSRSLRVDHNTGLIDPGNESLRLCCQCPALQSSALGLRRLFLLF